MTRLVVVIFLVIAAGANGAEQVSAAPGSGEVLLLDNHGQAVRAPASSLPAELRPRSEATQLSQVPSPKKGIKQSGAVEQKLAAMREGTPTFEWFPSATPKLASYLYSQDEFGNSAFHHGALIDVFPLEAQVQGVKTWLSDRGLRYSLSQTVTGSHMSEVEKGDSTLGNYSLELAARWAIFERRGAGATAGWLSLKAEYQTQVGGADPVQSVQSNIGALTNPLEFRSSHNSWRVPELAWQQSFDEGRIVALAGIIDQSNYLDANGYAGTGRGQFINSALVNSMVLPLPSYNYGLNLQWQPSNDWYGMLGYSVGNAKAGDAPGKNFSWKSWSLQGEIGYAPNDVLGLGPGVYRVQPFIAQAGDSVQGGVAINMQQRLGPRSPFGWFGRIGFGASEVSGGAKAQVGTGFVMNAPLSHAGWPRLTNDLLGVGFVWSQPSATTKTVHHDNEYVFETFYTLQLTPASILQADLQWIRNPAFNPEPGPIVLLQLQIVLKW